MADYSIHVLEYCYIAEHPKSAVMYGHHNMGTVKLPFGYVLVRGKDTVALVDVGHNNADHGAVLTRDYKIQNWHSPTDVLAPFGLTPEDVEHVFITHAHFDHMGGLALFPNAKFYIQEKELSNWVWTMSLDSRFRWLMGAMDTNDVLRAVELARDGRLVCLKGAREDVLPGIDLIPAYDTHTAGSQYVVVRNDGKTQSSDAWVLAGDLIYQFDNLDGGDPDDPYYHPVGLANGSQEKMVFAIHEMIQAAGGDRRRVIPAHEQHLGQRFPWREAPTGLQIVEICVADAHQSVVSDS
ncbi:MAG: N-acyl homoserine lactonase family protein [Rhizobiales bacterium]|nr:N-acyl homoserine lactonase family protein [Hyphomicrobiales bacterium]MBA68232.1 N-acyl homoserine lactonase family protein [Hyphomicrobiales bacterium]